MLPDTSMALPWPSIRRGLVFMSSRMSATIFSSRDLAGQHPLHGAPLLLELRLGQVVQSLGLGLEPLVDLLLRGDASGRCPAPRSANPAPRPRAPPGRTCRCGCSGRTPRCSSACRPSSSGVPVKPMNSALGSSAFIALCRSPDWVRWHSSTNTWRSPLALKSGRQLLDGLDERLGAIVALLFAIVLAAELVHQRAEQRFLGAVQLVDQVRAAGGAVDVLIDALEHLLDLLVQFGAVGDDQHPRTRHGSRVSTWPARPWSATCRCPGCAR